MIDYFIFTNRLCSEHDLICQHMQYHNEGGPELILQNMQDFCHVHGNDVNVTDSDSNSILMHSESLTCPTSDPRTRARDRMLTTDNT
jgi:hypothetical protein